MDHLEQIVSTEVLKNVPDNESQLKSFTTRRFIRSFAFASVSTHRDFFLKCLEDICPFLLGLFWTYDNVYPGFQIQDGSLTITSNCRQIWRPDQPMSLIVSSIVGGVNEQNSIVNKCLRR